MTKNETPLKIPEKRPKRKPDSMILSINTSNAITTGQAAFRAQLKAQREGNKK